MSDKHEGAPDRTNGSRDNQKARTRAALLAAAVKLLHEGRSPSMQEAATESLVSLATAYRYFPTAEDLWAEASLQATVADGLIQSVKDEIQAAGDDVTARALAHTKVVDWAFDHPLTTRLLAKAHLDRWFAQHQKDPNAEKVPVRAARRNEANRLVVEPLRGKLTDAECERLVKALSLVSGFDTAIVLQDALNLDRADAMAVLGDANRWLIAGALAEAKARAKKK